MKRITLFLIYGAVTIACLGLFAGWSWVYTTVQLKLATSRGLYATAEEGMQALIIPNYKDIDKIEIVYAGPNSFDGSDPHIWFVIARVYARSRADGKLLGNQPRNYEAPGSFFLHTKQGWAHVSEGAFPEFIGFWMKVYGLAGPGSTRPTHEMLLVK